jgi:preprotein translocase subunit Sss1
MDKNDIKEIVSNEIKKFVNDSLDKEMKRVLRNSSSQSRDELITTIKNAMESVYKVLWQKKEFWKADIK